MQKSILMKEIVIAVIVLFICTSVVPSITGTNWKNSDLEDAGDGENIQENRARFTPDAYNDIDATKNEEDESITFADSIKKGNTSESDCDILN